MEWQKALPWNWFSNEQPQVGSVDRPFSPHPLTQLHNEMDRLFEVAFSGFGLRPFTEQELPDMKDVMLKPKLDISESPEHFTITVEVAGVDRDDLNIALDGNVLTITGEKKQEKIEDKDNVHCVERRYGSFRRVLTLPANANPAQLNAKVDKGVLTLTIAKLGDGEDSRRKVEIQSS
ncbi:Hsp20/alpha crystallin family protein [Aestuariirhabdus sp. LZHN29]|uniref:Hsp20/alpha crystallin family protein n=1 Tax=Aestuariirhabdus sp. LZHN29 TaxID=3417462 RepID=UPI003CF89CCA